MSDGRQGHVDADLRQPDDSQSVVELTQTVGVVDTAPRLARRRRSGRQFAAETVDLGREIVAFGRANSGPICLVATLVGIVIWATVFSVLGVRNHRNFGTWAYDMAIYDQAFWLVSEGGSTFMTVRGLDVWGHHVNLIAYAFAPFYRFGAGPEFLYVVQNVSIAFGALPVYLIVKERFGKPLMALVFAVAYLLYAPAQWVAWINFHPEALVITPFLFAWYFFLRRWRGWFWVSVVVVLIMREDAALAVMMMGVVLLISTWRSDTRQADRRTAVGDHRPRIRLVPRRHPGDHSPLQQRGAAVLHELVLRRLRRDRRRHREEHPAPPRLAGSRRHPAGPHPVLPRPRSPARWVGDPVAAAPADGRPDDAGQRHRLDTLRPADPLPVHVDDARPDHHRLDRGGALPVEVHARSACCSGCGCSPVPT